MADDFLTENNNGSDSGKKKRIEPAPKAIKRVKRPPIVFIIFLCVAAIALVGLGWLDANGQLGLIFGRNKSAMPDNKPGKTASENGKETGADGANDQSFYFSLVKPAFAEYPAEDVSATPAAPEGKPAASEIPNLGSFGRDFSEAQLAALDDNSFFLADNDYISDQTQFRNTDDFADTYQYYSGSRNEYAREPDEALYISSDAALHLYHILIDRSFQKIEETKFQPMLIKMTEALFADSIDNYNRAGDPVMKETYKRLSVFYLIPLVILDAGSAGAGGAELSPSDFETYAQFLAAQDAQNEQASQEKLRFSLDGKTYGGFTLSDEIYDLAKAELALISDARDVAPSPLFTPYRPNFYNDYTQFKPRSHYTKNDILKSYFIAMMWYGRMGFTLDSPELTRDAIVITGQVNDVSADGEMVSDVYSTLSSAIEFFVGEVDDLTPYEYSSLVEKEYGGNLSVGELADDSVIAGFKKAAVDTLPSPRILSEVIQLDGYDSVTKEALLAGTMQFRFMGQRFTPDAYILNKLTQGDEAPDPETGQKLPSMPTALMPVRIIAPDNAVVNNYLDKWINDPVRIADQQRPSFDGHSEKIIAKVINQLDREFSGYDESVWTQNIYWNWLGSYRSLLSGYGQGYPYFMTTPAWQKKNLGTVLGSYTELKHDTLLYAKQSYAELGGGPGEQGELPPVPKGYVEADLGFWTRVTALAKMTAAGLKDRDLMPREFEGRYRTFIDNLEFFTDIVEKELANEAISDDDFEKLRLSGYAFTDITAPLSGEELTDRERRAGIIADIHTDAVRQKILYEATGKPYIIYVAVKDKNGARLTRGLVYNHYELTGPLDERYADEDWQAKVYDGEGELPPADEWSRDLAK